MQKRLRLMAAALMAALTVGSAWAQVDTTAVHAGTVLSDLTPTNVAPTDTVPAGEVPTVSYTLTPKRYTIAGIQVTGTKNYDDFILIGFSGLSVGDEVSIPGDEISDAVRRFWKHGLFSDVKILATRIQGDKVWLEIRLKQRPRISEIHYNGVKKSEREDLEAKLGLRKGHQITPNVMDRAKTLVKKYFDGKGFKNVEVDIVQREDAGKDGEVIVDVNISKNQKTRIREIHLNGNHALSDVTLKKAMKKTNEKFDLKKRFRTSWLELFSTKKFTSEEYENDKKNLIDKYNEYGYRDAVVTSDSIVPVDDKYVDIYLNLNEGDRYYLKDIRFVGNTKYPTEQLSMLLNMKAGDVYNQKKLQERLQSDDDAVSNIYYNNGYLFFYADPVEVEVENDSISLEIRIQEGPQATINKVIINGNDRLYENNIRRELRTKPGQLFSRDDLIRSAREIAQTGHFDPEKMNPEPIPNPDNGTVDIRYNLVSKASDQIELSAGWGPGGLLGRVGLKFNNFSMRNLFHPGTYRGIIPQGDGQTFTINGQTSGKYYQSYSLSFLDPWFGGKRPNTFSAGLSYSKFTGYNPRYLNQEYSRYMANSFYNNGIYGRNSYGSNGYSPYEQAYDPSKYYERFAVSVGFGKRLNWPDDYFYTMLTLNYQLFHMHDYTYFDVANGVCHKISLDLSLQRNSIDNPIYTRYGSQFLASVSFTPPYSLIDGKDYSKINDPAERHKLIEYHKWKFQGKMFFPLTPLPQNNGPKRTPVLMTRVEYGFLGYYNRHKGSPFESFQMGGDGMSGYTNYDYPTELIALRGYENNSIAGRSGQNAIPYAYAYSRLSMELRYPLILEPTSTIYGLAFVEGGNAWGSVRDFNPFDLKRSAGVGARIFLPMIGMIGIDWAYGFDRPYPGAQRGGSQIHFYLGQEF